MSQHNQLVSSSISICCIWYLTCLSNFLALEEEQRQRKEKEVAELEAFWRDYPLLIGSSMEGSKLHDTAYDKVTIKSEWIPENLEDDKDGEKKVDSLAFLGFFPYVAFILILSDFLTYFLIIILTVSRAH